MDGKQRGSRCRAAGLGNQGVKAACTAIEREIAAGTTPGAVLGVMHEGKQWFYSAGYANPRPMQGQPVPVSTDTLYDCASLTKVVVTPIDSAIDR